MATFSCHCAVCYGIISACVVATVALFVLHLKGPYGSFHLGLNIRPERGASQKPETEWLNMGYWKDTKIFPDACEALATKVIKRAKCVPGGRVLDVGHACGDSLLLYLQHPSIPRPATLYGITYLKTHHMRSLERISAFQTSQGANDCEIRLLCGDAVFRPHASNHPLQPDSTSPPLTSITAIDCAYHFASRELFLLQCYTRLAPGGTIALADLVVLKSPPCLLRLLLSRLLSVRSENIVTPHVYEAQLKQIGYVDIQIEDVSENVFPDFRNFLLARGGLWTLMAAVIGWWESAGGRFVIVSASRPRS